MVRATARSALLWSVLVRQVLLLYMASVAACTPPGPGQRCHRFLPRICICQLLVRSVSACRNMPGLGGRVRLRGRYRVRVRVRVSSWVEWGRVSSGSEYY